MSRTSAEESASRFVLIVAGEASADLHGANLVKAIRRLEPGAAFAGIGGAAMSEAGVRVLVPSSEMAVVGLTEVFSRLGTILASYRKMKGLLKEGRPDLLILIDYPGFNLRLAGVARALNVPVLYYIGPQVWAWRQGRVKKIKKRVSRMAVILPFEQAFYAERGVKVDYVGHPLLDACPREILQHGDAEVLPHESGDVKLGLMPGSRTEEISRLLPDMLLAAERLKRVFPSLHCVLPLAPTVKEDFLRSFTARAGLPVRITGATVYEALKGCRAALVASGTATLEVALMGIPMVILYRVSGLTYWAGRAVVRVPHIGLVNLVAGEEVARELIQGEATPENICAEVLPLMKEGEARRKSIGDLRRVQRLLGRGGASRKAAEIALEMMR
ncbi:MAG: lipid-A-disaccharide synthase [Deltaproteobacteria bacterium]|nr:lipid-A-disaccharide synthase [Deltaproteobacteria bacterium]